MRPELRMRWLATSFLLLACYGDDGPVAPPVPGAVSFMEVGAGYAHSCGLARTGTVFCWGGNTSGALGNGTLAPSLRPVAVSGGHTWRALSAGAAHTCALTAAGAAWCWGQNDEGQLGDGSFLARADPVAVTGAPAFTRISAGHAHTCGLTAAGAVHCWGDDSQGQLGDGGAAGGKSAVPVRVLSDEGFAQVAAGYYQTCAITTGGTGYCWGLGSSGQNGDSAQASRSEPAPVAGGHTYTQIAAGDRFACAANAERTWCWGVLTGTSVPLAMEGFPPLGAISAATGASTNPGAEPYACGLRSGTAWCWGGAVSPLRTAGEAALTPALEAQAVAAGALHVCVLDGGGYAHCGGRNHAGQLGDGTTAHRAALVPVAAPGTGS